LTIQHPQWGTAALVVLIASMIRFAALAIAVSGAFGGFVTGATAGSSPHPESRVSPAAAFG
jgi:hypothetical protein